MAPLAPDDPKLAVRVSAHPGNGLCPSRERKTSVGLQHATQVTPSPLTPCFSSSGTETAALNGARIGVPAAWHRQRSTSGREGRGREFQFRPRRWTANLQPPNQARCGAGVGSPALQAGEDVTASGFDLNSGIASSIYSVDDHPIVGFIPRRKPWAFALLPL